MDLSYSENCSITFYVFRKKKYVFRRFASDHTAVACRARETRSEGGRWIHRFAPSRLNSLTHAICSLFRALRLLRIEKIAKNLPLRDRLQNPDSARTGGARGSPRRRALHKHAPSSI